MGRIPFGYIYVVGSDSKVKIGMSTSPSGRFASLISASPFDIKPMFIYVCHVSEMKLAEKEVHRLFSHANIGREWFDMGGIDLSVLKSDPLPTNLDLAHSVLCPCCSVVPRWNGAIMRTMHAVYRDAH